MTGMKMTERTKQAHDELLTFIQEHGDYVVGLNVLSYLSSTAAILEGKRENIPAYTVDQTLFKEEEPA